MERSQLDPLVDQRRRVVAADDHPAILSVLVRILAPHCDVVATAMDGEDLLRQVRDMSPDVVVTDISMPFVNGLDACRSIRRMYPGIIVVIVSEQIDDDVIAFALTLGASAAIRKVDMIEQLPSAVLMCTRPSAVPCDFIVSAGLMNAQPLCGDKSYVRPARRGRRAGTLHRAFLALLSHRRGQDISLLNTE